MFEKSMYVMLCCAFLIFPLSVSSRAHCENEKYTFVHNTNVNIFFHFRFARRTNGEKMSIKRLCREPCTVVKEADYLLCRAGDVFQEFKIECCWLLPLFSLRCLCTDVSLRWVIGHVLMLKIAYAVCTFD